MIRHSLAALALAPLLVVAGCGGSSPGPTSARPPAAATSGGSWSTFGGSPSRASVAPGAPASPGLRRRFTRTLDGQVYAQPLIAGGRIYVATENNSVYAFTTSGRLVWRRNLGAPVPGSALECGNINPSGITGTPVISGGRIYAVTYLRSGLTHELVGLDVTDGHVAVRANVDPANRTVQQERGALLASNGRVYVPYGGMDGDCGPYRGVVVSTRTDGSGRISYVNPATLAGMWAPAGVSQQSGTLLVSTGNGGGASFAYQSSVLRLSTSLQRVGFWAPANWRQLSEGDVDVGSLSPLPVSGGRVFQIGKEGVGYLIRNSLGGIGRQQFTARVCSGGAFGADAFRAPFVITQCGGSLYALRVGSSRFEVAWKSPAGGAVPVIAGDSVYAITRGGMLNQLRISDGTRLGSVQLGSPGTSFPAPSAAGSTLVAPAGRGIVVFSI